MAREANSKLAQATTIWPGDSIDRGAIGRALDYRLRYYFDITPAYKFTAFRGANRIMRPGSAADSFFASLDQIVRAMQPVRRRLDKVPESSLVRYCYALALFEELYRERDAISRSPLLVPSPVSSITELLAIPSPAAVDDLCALSWAFYDSFSDLIGGTQTIVLNPEFDGSRDVSGADADVILDGCLLEFKTSVRPKLDSFWLYQLLGYVLLDYSDRHQIRDVGVYMARQQVLLRWPLVELMGAMASAPAPDLADVRAQFRHIAEGVRNSRSALRASAAPGAPPAARVRLPREASGSGRAAIAIAARPDLTAYVDIIDAVWEQGSVGADLTLKEGERQRTEKRRLSIAAKLRGLSLAWRKAQPGHLRFVLAAAGERPPGGRKRRENRRGERT